MKTAGFINIVIFSVTIPLCGSVFAGLSPTDQDKSLNIDKYIYERDYNSTQFPSGMEKPAPFFSAAVPAILLLKALAPMFKPRVEQENADYLNRKNKVDGQPTQLKKAKIVQQFLYESEKFDDLSSRYEIDQNNREVKKTILLSSQFDEIITDNTNEKILKEYLRRIYQGYSETATNESMKNRSNHSETILDIGKNIIVNYQTIGFGDYVETRVGYDPVANVARFALATPIFDSELSYFVVDRKSPPTIPEQIRTIDEAMDEFAHFDRMSVSLAHTFHIIDLRLKAKYGVIDGAIDYGFSKKLFGPLALQVVRQDSIRDLPGFLAAQLTFGIRF